MSIMPAFPQQAGSHVKGQKGIRYSWCPAEGEERCCARVQRSGLRSHSAHDSRTTQAGHYPLLWLKGCNSTGPSLPRNGDSED